MLRRGLLLWQRMVRVWMDPQVGIQRRRPCRGPAVVRQPAALGHGLGGTVLGAAVAVHLWPARLVFYVRLLQI